VDLSRIGSMLRRSVVQWTADHVPRRAAALAFYAGFSLAPLLLIAIAIGGLAFGADAVKGRVVEQLQGLLGPDAARAVETALKNTRTTGPSILATLIGFLTLFLGASGVFGELQDSLNEIWKEKKPGLGIRGVFRSRVLSFTFVVGFGFLLLVSLLLNAILEAATRLVATRIPAPGLLRTASMVVSFAVIATMFAMMFKKLPDARTRWRDVWLGAAVTAVLFNIGKWLIGLYLGHSALSSSYGAAGSFVVLLMWLYYSSQVVLLGAEITRAYAHEFGTEPVPNENAISLERPEPEPVSSSPHREDSGRS
jgi:membrane protein